MHVSLVHAMRIERSCCVMCIVCIDHTRKIDVDRRTRPAYNSRPNRWYGEVVVAKLCSSFFIMITSQLVCEGRTRTRHTKRISNIFFVHFLFNAVSLLFVAMMLLRCKTIQDYLVWRMSTGLRWQGWWLMKIIWTQSMTIFYAALFVFALTVTTGSNNNIVSCIG